MVAAHPDSPRAAGAATAKPAGFPQDRSAVGSFLHSQSSLTRGACGTENQAHAHQRTLLKFRRRNKLEPGSGAASENAERSKGRALQGAAAARPAGARSERQITAHCPLAVAFPAVSSLVSLEKLHPSKPRRERN